MLGGWWQLLLCPAHGLSPEKFHFWAELKSRSCREAVSVVGLLLAELQGWASPQNHFQLKRSGNGWTRPRIKTVLGCGCGESRAVPGMGGRGGVRQGCPQGWWHPKRCSVSLLLRGSPGCGCRAAGGSSAGEEGFFQALPVGGKHKGHRSGLS